MSSNNNANSAIRVLKKIGLLQESGQPTDDYAFYMVPATGSAVLGRKVRETYRVLFENSLSPQSASNDELRRLFNIHSGGGEDAMRLQIQTFKTLAEFATFQDNESSTASDEAQRAVGNAADGQSGKVKLPPVQLDLHIHLPENKSTRDYESIIQFDKGVVIAGLAVERFRW